MKTMSEILKIIEMREVGMQFSAQNANNPTPPSGYRFWESEYTNRDKVIIDRKIAIAEALKKSEVFKIFSNKGISTEDLNTLAYALAGTYDNTIPPNNGTQIEKPQPLKEFLTYDSSNVNNIDFAHESIIDLLQNFDAYPNDYQTVYTFTAERRAELLAGLIKKGGMFENDKEGAEKHIKHRESMDTNMYYKAGQLTEIGINQDVANRIASKCPANMLKGALYFTKELAELEKNTNIFPATAGKMESYTPPKNNIPDYDSGSTVQVTTQILQQKISGNVIYANFKNSFLKKEDDIKKKRLRVFSINLKRLSY